jgi:hypothetical protein
LWFRFFCWFRPWRECVRPVARSFIVQSFAALEGDTSPAGNGILGIVARWVHELQQRSSEAAHGLLVGEVQGIGQELVEIHFAWLSAQASEHFREVIQRKRGAVVWRDGLSVIGADREPDHGAEKVRVRLGPLWQG